MEIASAPSGAPELRSPLVSLGEIHPVVNGRMVTSPPPRAWQVGDRLYFEFQIDIESGNAFCLEIEQVSPSECALRYSLNGVADPGKVQSFGVCFTRIENLRQYLRHGYHSWDGSYFVDPEALSNWNADETRPETGYAMTLLLPRSGSGSLVLGFDRHDRFQQTFTFNTRALPLTLAVETVWDGKHPSHTGRCESETLLIFEHPAVEEALRVWARRVAAASPLPLRQPPPITGWCSWYNLYNYATEENILQHLAGARQIVEKSGLPLQVFQIDDSFTPEMGDWLEVKPQFPRGMKPLLEDIRSAGFTPGLWIAPFLVGNRSRLFRDHPDWVLRERVTGQPLAQMKFYGEFRWGKRSEETYILDASHPAALDYLRRVFRTWRQDWGCEYFKTDFMFFACAYGPEQVHYHTPGLTRIEIWRRAAEMIRKEIDTALWTGCGSPLWAAVGLVDGMRIGRDVGVSWSGNQSAQSLLRDQATRNFTNHIFWQNDPDCILLRDRFHHLSEAELRSLALFAGMSGGLMMTSDALDELPPARLALFKLATNPRRRECDFPLLGQSEVVSIPGSKSAHELQLLDPVSVQVRRGETSAVFIFNTGDSPVQRSFFLADLGLPSDQYLYDWVHASSGPEPTNALHVTLAPHDSALIFVQPQPFLNPPETLP